MENNFRKFLIVSTYAPPSISGASLMMYNLLKYFPKDSFAFLTTHSDINDRSLKIGKKLDAKYYYFDSFGLQEKPQTGETSFQKVKSFIKRFKFLRLFMHRAIIFYWPFKALRHGKRIIKDEGMELLIGYSDIGTAFLSTYLLHKATKKPFFLYFYDLYYGNKSSFIYRTLAYFLEPRLFKSAEKIFVMNELLKEHYEKKYNREVFVIRNSIAIEDYPKPIEKKDNSPIFKIVFTGAVYWAQSQAIRNLIKAVNNLKDKNIQFWIYTTYDKKAIHEQGIFEGGRVFFASCGPSEAPEVQRNADVLFVPLSFEKENALLINTSSPGKTYEYLISGRPILIHAPKDSYIARYAKENDLALVVGEDDIGELENAIETLARDKNLSQRITDNAYKTVLKNHDARKNSEFFQSFFNQN